MRAMSDRIITSTPFFDKFIKPPPRTLWAADSPTEQLYFNKWKKYRNSTADDDKRSWNDIDAPNFIDFQHLSDVKDSYFGNDENENNPSHRLHVHERLLSWDFEDNTLLELVQCSGTSPNHVSYMTNTFNSSRGLKKCTLSIINKSDKDCRDEIDESNNLEATVVPVPDLFESLKVLTTSGVGNSNENVVIQEPIPSHQSVTQDNIKNVQGGKSKIGKIRTTVEPFSFEIREKGMQEHKQARRERDSIGKETRKGFRANPVPSFVKSRAKITATKKPPETEKTKRVEQIKIRNTVENCKKKPFQHIHAKRPPIIPKSPELLTAVRARERKRFEEQLKEKEQQRLAFLKMQEIERQKQEKQEIAKLRKELVHKAQPIRRYKMIVPVVQKRPLLDQIASMPCKRQRKD